MQGYAARCSGSPAPFEFRHFFKPIPRLFQPTFSNTRILIFFISSSSQPSRLRYQSRCGDHTPQPPTSGWWQQVSSHCLPQAGHRPAVSKVCQEWPQVHDHWSAGVGSQLHFGHAIFTSAMVLNFIQTWMPQIEKPGFNGVRSAMGAGQRSPVVCFSCGQQQHLFADAYG